MDKDELVEKLKALADRQERYAIDTESLHQEADALLLEYVNDTAVREQWERLTLWYA